MNIPVLCVSVFGCFLAAVAPSFASGSGPVISEIHPGGSSGCLALHNPSASVIMLAGWKIQVCPVSASGDKTAGRRWVTKIKFRCCEAIGPLTTYRVAGNRWRGGRRGTDADFRTGFPFGFLPAAGSVRLVNPDGDVVDLVGYGEPPVSGILNAERRPIAGFPPYIRRNAGQDTDDNALDFAVSDVIPAAGACFPQQPALVPQQPEKARELYYQGMKAHAGGMLARARELWIRALEFSPDDLKIRRALETLDSGRAAR